MPAQERGRGERDNSRMIFRTDPGDPPSVVGEPRRGREGEEGSCSALSLPGADESTSGASGVVGVLGTSCV